MESEIDGNIKLPEDIIICDNDARVLQNELITYVYNGIKENYNDHMWLTDIGVADFSFVI